MAGNKYQTLVAGRDTLVAGTQTSTGATNANQIPALDSSGHLDVSLLPVGVGPDVAVIVASEALSAGNYVNIYSNAGVVNCRKADNSNDRPAMGYVIASVASAASATVYFEGGNSNLTGLTIGARYYLGTAGVPTATAPSTGGGALISQFVGIAVSTTTINTDIDDEVVL